METPSSGGMFGFLVIVGVVAVGFVALLSLGHAAWNASDEAETRWGGWLGRAVSLVFLIAGMGGAVLTACGLWVGGHATYDQWSSERARVAEVRRECTEVRLPEWIAWMKGPPFPDMWSPYQDSPMKNRTLGPAAEREYVDRCVAANLEDD